MTKNEIDRELMEGLDDLAHRRVFEIIDKKHVKIKNYGKRDKRYKCYCKDLKREKG